MRERMKKYEAGGISMNGKYEDILSAPHHVSQVHPHMSLHDRAAQFSPFAALTGYDAEVKETARLTEPRLELDEYEKDDLNEKLMRIAGHLASEPEVEITYFLPDPNKTGGAYVTASGIVKKVDAYEGKVVMADGAEIPMKEIVEIKEAN